MGVQVIRIAEGSFRIEGELEFDTVPAAAAAAAGFAGSSAEVAVDLSGVVRADSSAVALLLDWIALARARRATVRFINVPDQMRAIIRVCELESVLAPET